jgi:hypothetical protein
MFRAPPIMHGCTLFKRALLPCSRPRLTQILQKVDRHLFLIIIHTCLAPWLSRLLDVPHPTSPPYRAATRSCILISSLPAPAPPPPLQSCAYVFSLLRTYLPYLLFVQAWTEPHYSRAVLGGYEDGRLVASTSCTRNQSRDTTHVAIHYQGLNAEGYNTVGCVNRYIFLVYEEEGQVFSFALVDCIGPHPFHGPSNTRYPVFMLYHMRVPLLLLYLAYRI